MHNVLGYVRRTGVLTPVTIIEVKEPATPPLLTDRERRIRKLIRLLETADLEAERYPEMLQLMEEFESELEEIISKNSLKERCCVDGVSCSCRVRVVGRFDGLLPEVDCRHTDDDVIEAQVLNASGYGHRIEKRKIGFAI